ncbi:MAG: hypothetical protein PHG00_13605 [Methylococcales bacterium]|nr:hypothetical protein [Methylococcales bacterium]
MKIKPGPISRRTQVYEVQAHYMAKAIYSLVDAYSREFRPNTELTLEIFYRFRGLNEYKQFEEAAFVCGFVCTDYSRFFPLDKAHERPLEVIPSLSFSKLRHYIHTLQRAEKWNSEYSGSLWTAVQCGALSLVARRLESDQSLYEINDEYDEEEI